MIWKGLYCDVTIQPKANPPMMIIDMND